MSHSRWKTLRERKLAQGFVESEDVTEARSEIRLAMALAKAVYERRIELGLTQTELAARAGLTQAKVSRVEGSDTVPTLPLLAKLAKALPAAARP
jgi:DNA-binding XRE family transcriptional regulator